MEGANSDRNHFVDNIVHSATPVLRHAINITAGNVNTFVANRAVGTYGTSPYNDAGTGTVTAFPGAAAPQGDNFVG